MSKSLHLIYSFITLYERKIALILRPRKDAKKNRMSKVEKTFIVQINLIKSILEKVLKISLNKKIERIRLNCSDDFFYNNNVSSKDSIDA